MSEKGWYERISSSSITNAILACAIMVAVVFAIISTVFVLIPVFSSGVFHCTFGNDFFKKSLDSNNNNNNEKSGDNPRDLALETTLNRTEEFLQFKSGLEGTAYGNCHAFCARASCFLLETQECIKGNDGQNPKCTSPSSCFQECDLCAEGISPSSILPLTQEVCLSDKDCKKFGFALGTHVASDK